MGRPSASSVPATAAALAILLAFGLALAFANGHVPGRASEASDREASDRGASPAGRPSRFEPASPRQIARRVAALRGLEFERFPRLRWLDADEWRRRTRRAAARADRGGARERRETAALEDFLQLSGLATPGFDAEQATKGIGELIGGFYRPRSNRLILVEQPISSPKLDERTVAHEIGHALQDQAYPRVLRGIGSRSDERELGLSALLEGDAAVVERRYGRRHLDLPTPDLEKSLLSPTNLALGLPPALVASIRFPYTSGTDFVAALRRRGGWPLVNRAFRRPPKTTEQILHPGKWIAGEGSVPAPTGAEAVLGDGWRRLARVESGELDAILILASGAPADLAQRAGKGWQGGRFEVFRRAGAGSACRPPCRERRAAVVAFRWQTPADAAEFAAAAERYLTARLLDGRRRDLAFEVGTAAASLELGRRATSIAYAPSVSLARELAAAALGPDAP